MTDSFLQKLKGQKGFMSIKLPCEGEDMISIDRRSLLEVSDPKHRYGKNLRVYYDEWLRRGGVIDRTLSGAIERTLSIRIDPGEFTEFFRWLDDPIAPPSLDICPRELLEGDTVAYCRSKADRDRYAVRFDQQGRLHRYSGNQIRITIKDRHHEEMGTIIEAETVTNDERLVSESVEDDETTLLSTGKSGHIFVARGGVLYSHVKRTDAPPRFHHSSFFAGEAVEAAGILVCEQGERLVLYPHSGHYRPTDRHFLNLLLFLRSRRVDLGAVTVDVQRTLRMARVLLPGGEKAKKKDTAQMWRGLELYHFLRTKIHAWDCGLFAELLVRAAERDTRRLRIAGDVCDAARKTTQTTVLVLGNECATADNEGAAAAVAAAADTDVALTSLAFSSTPPPSCSATSVQQPAANSADQQQHSQQQLELQSMAVDKNITTASISLSKGRKQLPEDFFCCCMS